MVYKMARYRVKPDKVVECEAAIVEFIGAIAAFEPRTLRYDSYRLPDGVSYLHVFAFADADAEELHKVTAHVLTFVEKLYPHCDEPPVFTELALVAAASRA